MHSILKLPLNVISKSIHRWQNNLQQETALETAKQRSVVIGCSILIGFLAVIVRLGDVMLLKQRDRFAVKDVDDFQVVRADIVDRNNQTLATNLITASAYANPKHIINMEEACQKLATVITDLSPKEIEKRIKSGKSFVWLARHISPKMQSDILSLGIPGVYMYRDQTRIYPHGSLLSHIVGMCGIDGNGLAGIEAFFDAKLQGDKEPLALSIDIRVQHILHDELSKGVDEFSAEGANAIVMHAKTGEILGMVSLPDFDPHAPSKSPSDALFNRNTLGVYEPGSVFKILNVSIALESGKAKLNSIFDGSAPVQIGRFKVSDFKGLNRPMTLVEAFVRSSNIASIKIAQQFGSEVQKDYMKRFGVMDKISLELPEVGAPQLPKDWTNVSMMTISYGYGISQTPLQMISIVASILNDGYKINPTLIKCGDSIERGHSILSEKTSKIVRSLMRQTVLEGTSRKADVPGYNVMGKTGTAYKRNGKSGYGSDGNRSRRTTFIGGFPEQDPEIVLVVMVDDPKASKKTAGYATAGWNAAKIAGDIIKKIAPLYVQPETPTENPFVLSEEDKQSLMNEKELESLDDLFDEQPMIRTVSMKESSKSAG